MSLLISPRRKSAPRSRPSVRPLISKRPAQSRPLIEALESRQLLSGTIWSNGVTSYGVTAQSSEPLGYYMGNTTPWTLSLGSVPAHTQATNNCFSMGVVLCGCGGGSSGSFTLSLDGHVVSSVNVPNLISGGGASLPDATTPHTADSMTWTITPNLPVGWYYKVTQGSVSVTTNVWAAKVQDGTRGSTGAPVIFSLNRDGVSDKPTTVYYGINGVSVQNSPSDYADVSGPVLDPGGSGYYVATIPANQSSVNVSLQPTDILWTGGDGQQLSDVPTPVTLTVFSPPPVTNVVAYDLPNGVNTPSSAIANLATTNQSVTWFGPDATGKPRERTGIGMTLSNKASARNPQTITFKIKGAGSGTPCTVTAPPGGFITVTGASTTLGVGGSGTATLTATATGDGDLNVNVPGIGSFNLHVTVGP
jgi:hypothetical protein